VAVATQAETPKKNRILLFEDKLSVFQRKTLVENYHEDLAARA
jgi:hypothetical protein